MFVSRIAISVTVSRSPRSPTSMEDLPSEDPVDQNIASANEKQNKKSDMNNGQWLERNRAEMGHHDSTMLASFALSIAYSGSAGVDESAGFTSLGPITALLKRIIAHVLS